MEPVDGSHPTSSTRASPRPARDGSAGGVGLKIDAEGLDAVESYGISGRALPGRSALVEARRRAEKTRNSDPRKFPSRSKSSLAMQSR
jgi:hypothetical protein